MTTVQRFDRGNLRKSYRTPEGYLFAEGLATRTGVLLYRNDDGSARRELRPPEEVMNPASLGTLGRRPVTLGHPMDEQGRPVKVDSKNVEEYGVGTVGETIFREQGGFVKVDLTLQREDAIKAVESGTRELSCGYDCRLDWTEGEWFGEPFDCIQRDIAYNHLAVVDRGRAGSKVRMNVDHGDAIVTPGDLPIAGRYRGWDAGAATRRVKEWAGTESGDLAKNRAFRSAFLLVDGDPNNYSSYKLPVADVYEDRLYLIPRAVFAVAAVLEGARGGIKASAADKKRLRGVVSRLYRRMAHHFEDTSIIAPWDRSSAGRGDGRSSIMPSIEHKGVRYDVEDNIARIVAEVREDAANMKKMYEDMKSKYEDKCKAFDELKGKFDILTADMEKMKAKHSKGDDGEGDGAGESSGDDADQKRADEEARIAWFNERQELLKVAEPYKIDKIDEMTNANIKRAVVGAHMKKERMDASDDYIAAAYDFMVNQEQQRSDGALRILQGATTPPQPPKGSNGQPKDGRQDYLDAVAEYDKGRGYQPQTD